MFMLVSAVSCILFEITSSGYYERRDTKKIQNQMNEKTSCQRKRKLDSYDFFYKFEVRERVTRYEGGNLILSELSHFRRLFEIAESSLSYFSRHHFDNLLITLMSAPFSSLSRWFSDLNVSICCEWNIKRQTLFSIQNQKNSSWYKKEIHQWSKNYFR